MLAHTTFFLEKVSARMGITSPPIIRPNGEMEITALCSVADGVRLAAYGTITGFEKFWPIKSTKTVTRQQM